MTGQWDDPTEPVSVAVAADPYVSPLMAKVRTGPGNRLTIGLLALEVPVFQKGIAAAKALPSAPAHDRERLARDIRDGERAQERTLLAALPLIRHLAQKELRRRQQWRTQATLDDLAQEGFAGLIRGLKAYNVDGANKSPTNYLGQWITTEMRRNAEDMDNDFGVAFDAAERFRRIRALRSRLSVALRRDPTDEEIVAASINPEYAARSPFAGRGTAGVNAPGKGLTLEQLKQEREFRTRIGRTSRLGEEAEDSPPTVESARPLDSRGVTDDAATALTEQAGREAIAVLMHQTLDIMGLPVVQRDIVARRYGLPPHEREASARDISRDLNVHRDRVGKVLEAFSEEMARPNGPFHQACSKLLPDELAELGLGWVTRVLGSVDPTAPRPTVPDALRVPMALRRRAALAPPPVFAPAGKGIFAQFYCDYHSRFFSGAYQSAAEVPKARDCPSCGRPSSLQRQMLA